MRHDGHVKPREQHLGREELLERALALIAADGVESLTVRRLCDSLGVAPPSIYWQVRNKDDLLRLCAEEVLGAIPLPGPELGDWADQMREFAARFRRAILRYRGLAAVVVRLQPLAASVSIAEQQIGVLLDAGFPPEKAAAAFTALSVYTAGQLLFIDAMGGAYQGDAAVDTLLDRIEEAAPGPHPHIDQVNRQGLDHGRAASHVDYGLERLLDGLRLDLERGRHRASTPRRRA
ncbi:MAG: TetR family transcriptional regulator [Frankiales bacterium]|nr:TetR family transcriptional regulator [Frankiales bacterium]